MSLNNYGKAYLIVPNTLLNGDSNHHTLTKQYLVNNFNVSRIIYIDIFNSIIFFEKNGMTKCISFEKINNLNQINNDNIINIYTIPYEEIVKKNYNLYYEKYIDISNTIGRQSIDGLLSDILSNDTKLSNIVDIVDIGNLQIPLYLDNMKVCIIDDPVKNSNYISLKVKNEDIISQKYVNYYFYYVISPKLLTITTGKLKKLDLEKLLEYTINIPSIEKMNKVIECIENKHKTILYNNTLINEKILAKSMFIDLYTLHSKSVMLKSICSIDVKPTNDTQISIQKNSMAAGTVYIYKNTDNNNNNTNDYNTNDYNTNDYNTNDYNTNLYYINNIKTIDPICLYYILQNDKEKLNKLALLTNNISRTNLENYEICIPSEEFQKKIINVVNTFDKMCENILADNILIEKLFDIDIIFS
jgi:hypothetical protein